MVPPVVSAIAVDARIEKSEADRSVVSARIVVTPVKIKLTLVNGNRRKDVGSRVPLELIGNFQFPAALCAHLVMFANHLLYRWLADMHAQADIAFIPAAGLVTPATYQVMLVKTIYANHPHAEIIARMARNQVVSDMMRLNVFICHGAPVSRKSRARMIIFLLSDRKASISVQSDAELARNVLQDMW